MPLAALIPGMLQSVHGILGLMWVWGFSAVPTCPSCLWCSTGRDPWETLLEELNCIGVVDPASSFPLHPPWAQGRAQDFGI